MSQTPYEALAREWEENDLIKYVEGNCRAGTWNKAEHLSLSAKGKYPDNKILMIGDAKGDLDAARKNGILFYP